MPRITRRLETTVLAFLMLGTLLLVTCAPALALPAPSGEEPVAPASTDGSPDGSDPAVTGVDKIADPDSSSSWLDFLGGENDGSYSTANAGRIWVDASAYADEEAASAAGIADGSFHDPENGFLVSISAIAQTASIHQQDGGGHDVVFVVSMNGVLGSMVYAERDCGGNPGPNPSYATSPKSLRYCMGLL